MNVSLTQEACIAFIRDHEIKQITRAFTEHFAVPIILGFSMDDVSQQEFEAMGGRGRKQEPISSEKKLEIYSRSEKFIKQKILKETAQVVNSLLEQSLGTFSVEELQLKVADINARVMEPEPNWRIFPRLEHDETCLFKDLQKTTNLKVNLIDLHEKFCPILSKDRDSGALFKIIHMDEFLV